MTWLRTKLQKIRFSAVCFMNNDKNIQTKHVSLFFNICLYLSKEFSNKIVKVKSRLGRGITIKPPINTPIEHPDVGQTS